MTAQHPTVWAFVVVIAVIVSEVVCAVAGVRVPGIVDTIGLAAVFGGLAWGTPPTTPAVAQVETPAGDVARLSQGPGAAELASRPASVHQ